MYSYLVAIIYCFTSVCRSGAIARTDIEPGYGTIWLDEVGCTSSDTELGECDHYGWGRHNCGHSEDVGVDCDGKQCVSF